MKGKDVAWIGLVIAFIIVVGALIFHAHKNAIFVAGGGLLVFIFIVVYFVWDTLKVSNKTPPAYKTIALGLKTHKIDWYIADMPNGKYSFMPLSQGGAEGARKCDVILDLATKDRVAKLLKNNLIENADMTRGILDALDKYEKISMLMPFHESILCTIYYCSANFYYRINNEFSVLNSSKLLASDLRIVDNLIKKTFIPVDKINALVSEINKIYVEFTKECEAKNAPHITYVKEVEDLFKSIIDDLSKRTKK